MRLTPQTLQFDRLAPRGEAESGPPEGPLRRAFGLVPGETARCLVGKKRKGARQAWVQEVMVASPHRVEPRCPHFGACGGCALQHVDYPEQLALKSAAVYAQLGGAYPEAELLPPRPAPGRWHYRSKVEFSFQRDPTRLGFNRRGRFDWLVDVDHCYIGPPGNRAVLAATRDWAHRNRLSGWDPRRNTGQLRYLVLRYAYASGQWLAVLVSGPGDLPVAELAERLSALGAHGVLWARQSSVAGAVAPDSEELLAGEPTICERLGRLRFVLGWRSFFQSNPPAFAAMLDEARAWTELGPRDRLLDLFCGVGTVGLSLGGVLTGVEAVAPAVADARRNAALNGLPGEFFCAAAEDWEQLDCDLAVLDPPRSGCHPRLLRRLVETGPPRLLYISCNPAALAQELELLGQAYRLVRARAYDFFPNTRHLETLCLLERATARMLSQRRAARCSAADADICP